MNTQRLLKLAQHLKTGKLGHKEFNFDVVHHPFHSDWEIFPASESDKKNYCGSQGCALGELPIAFPRHYRYAKRGAGVLLKSSNKGVFDTSGKFFDIPKEHINALFTPVSDYELTPGLPYIKTLLKTATRKQVAANIERYVRYHKKNGTISETHYGSK